MNNDSRKKELFLKLQFGTYLMASVTISSKRHSQYARVSLD